MLATLRERLQVRSAAELTQIFEQAGLPYAPIVRPEQLFDDPHLRATGGLAEVRLTDGEKAGAHARAALLPLTMDGQRLGVWQQPPYSGEHTDSLLSGLGLTQTDIEGLRQHGAVA